MTEGNNNNVDSSTTPPPPPASDQVLAKTASNGLIRFEEDEGGNAEADDTQESSQEDMVGGSCFVTGAWSDEEVEETATPRQMIKRRSLGRRPIRGSGRSYASGSGSISRHGGSGGPVRNRSSRFMAESEEVAAGGAGTPPCVTTSDEYPCSSSQRSTLDSNRVSVGGVSHRHQHHKIALTTSSDEGGFDDEDVTTEVASSMTPRQSASFPTNV